MNFMILSKRIKLNELLNFKVFKQEYKNDNLLGTMGDV